MRDNGSSRFFPEFMINQFLAENIAKNKMLEIKENKISEELTRNLNEVAKMLQIFSAGRGPSSSPDVGCSRSGRLVRLKKLLFLSTKGNHFVYQAGMCAVFVLNICLIMFLFIDLMAQHGLNECILLRDIYV